MPSVHFTNRVVIGAKTEGTSPGSYAAPEVGLKGVRLAGAPSFSFDSRFFDPEPVGTTYSNEQGTYGGSTVTINASFDLVGSGVSATTKPGFADLWEACGMIFEDAELVSGAVDSGTFIPGEKITQASTDATSYFIELDDSSEMVCGPISGTEDNSNDWIGAVSGAAYTPDAVGAAHSKVARYDSSPSTRSISFHAQRDQGGSDGTEYKFAGCIGTWSADVSGVGAPVRINCQITGVPHSTPKEDVTFPSIDYQTPTSNAFFNVGFASEGYGTSDLCLNTFSITSNINVAVADCANNATGYQYAYMRGRSPEGGFNAQMVETSAFNEIAKLTAQTPGVTSFALGSATGNRVKFYAGRTTYRGVSTEDDNGIFRIQHPFKFNKVGNQNDTELLFLFD